MITSIFKILIIGFGSIGKRHYKILKKLLPQAQIDLVTNQFVKGVNTFKSLKEIKRIDLYDYFVISSETVKHFEQLYYITSKVNNKIILVEKPLFHRFKTLEIKNNLVYVGYNLRFHPIVKEVKNRVKNCRVLYINVIAGQYLPLWRPGRDYRNTYSAHKERGGGVLLDLSHEIDYLQWLGGEIVEVYGINKKISNLEINSDDIVTAIGKTENEVIINFSMDYISKIPVRKIVVYTENETYIGDLLEGILLIAKQTGYLEEKRYNIEKNYTYEKMHEEILSGKTENVCTYEEGLLVLKTVEKIRSSNV